MFFIDSLLRKTLSERPLLAQIFFTALTFTVLAIVGVKFARDISRDFLTQNTLNTLESVQGKIDADMHLAHAVILGFSETVRGMLLNGYNEEELNENTQRISNAFYHGITPLPSFKGVYGYVEISSGKKVFLNGLVHTDVSLPQDYDPTQRLWYKTSLDAGDSIVRTRIFEDVFTGKTVFALLRNIFDEQGRNIGVVCVNIETSDIGEYVMETALAQGGYGILTDEYFTILAHPNSQFVKKSMNDPVVPSSALVSELVVNREILSRPLKSHKGEDAIAFFRQIPCGWYLGLVVPKGPYYANVTNMSFALAFLGALFAGILIAILINIDAAKVKSDNESKYKSAFLANMSHEIRTPMNAIIGMTSIGQNAHDLEKKDYCFSKIDDASKHLLGVINDVLDMSKIEANKLELSFAEFDFEKMLQRVVNVVNFRISEKQQNLSVRIDKKIPEMLFGDDQRLAQVITNLLSNATKFTPEGGSVCLDTRLLNESADGGCVIRFSVSDTGIGMTKAQQDLLFRAFQQAESDTSRRFGGSGLGLYISKSIIEMMNGKIWVESEAGKGSNFIFEVHLKRGEGEGKTEIKSLRRGVNWNNVKILVVDDDPDTLSYTQDMLRGFGVECDIALSATEALHLVKSKGGYNVYFVDWKMPDMDGIMLAERLKDSGYAVSGDSVVIMISALEYSVIEESAKNAGVSKFLPKPLFPSAVMDVLNEFLDLTVKPKTAEKRTNVDGYLEGYSVLLAEDVAVNCEIVLALFEPTKLRIDCAENGAQAVEKFAANPEKYDLIFMDLQMPKMDGYEAARRIRAMNNVPQAKTVPIIAMTANVFKEDVERCLEVGMNDHVGKPLDFDDVFEKLRKYLPGKPGNSSNS